MSPVGCSRTGWWWQCKHGNVIIVARVAWFLRCDMTFRMGAFRVSEFFMRLHQTLQVYSTIYSDLQRGVVRHMMAVQDFLRVGNYSREQLVEREVT